MSFSVFLAALYAFAGFVLFNLSPEHMLLASIVVVLTGILPDIDGGNDAPAKEVGGLLAATFPLLLIEQFPGVRQGDVARLALVLICGYLLSRLLIMRFLKSFTVKRGIIHSVPAAIVTAELTYLLLWDLRLSAKIFIALGAFLGFLAHLLMDAYTNIDLLARASGDKKKQPAVMKLAGGNTKATLAMYCTLLILTWFVLKDLYPHLRVHARVVY